MTKHIEYTTKGTCSRKIIIDVEDGVIVDCKFVAGCSGNTMGVSALVKGMTVEEVISRLKLPLKLKQQKDLPVLTSNSACIFLFYGNILCNRAFFNFTIPYI